MNFNRLPWSLDSKPRRLPDFRCLRVMAGLGAALCFGAISSGVAAGTQRLPGHVPQAVARFNLQPTGRLPATNRLHLAVGLPLRNPAALDEFLQQLYDPASPGFHQYLTPKPFTERFGPTEQDYQALAAFLKANGLEIIATHPNRVVLDVQGSVADIERVLHVTMRTYPHPKEARDFYAPDVEPSIDLSLAGVHISGLDNYWLPRPAGLKVKPLPAGTAKATPNSGSGPGGAFMGGDFRAAYLPGVSLNGAGQIVGLLQFDGYYSNDIASYESQAGLPGVSLTNVPIDGGVSTPGSGVDEVSLDIEMVISMSPGISQIIVYEAPNPSPWPDLLNRMANDNLARQISCSWGGGSPDPTSEAIFKQMAAQGQSFFNASGDSDAFTGSIPFPAESTNITQVGGTTLSTTGPGGSYVSETVWNSGGGLGSSGGISPTYAIPSWQQGINMTANHGSTTMRNIPDVALTGDNVWVIYGNGQSGAFVGTSCAAPLWAGFTALVNQQAALLGRPPVGFVNPAIYAIGKSNIYNACFHDITTGNNTWSGSPNLFYATNGYDLCTGWGTPAGTNLINALVGFTDPLGVTPSTNFSAVSAPGGSFNVTSQNYLLTNWGTVALNWSLINTSSWLNASATNGTLTPGGAASTVTLSLTSSTTNLGVGTYVAIVWFSNATTHIAQSRQFTLLVVQPLQISPSAGFSASGPVGGPFNVASQDYTLTNVGTISLNWSLINTSLWLNASPGGGALAPGGAATTVTVSLNSTAYSLAGGVYTASLGFTNLTTHAAQSLPFTLLVGQSLVQNGGFETGNFSGWTLSGNTAYTSVTSGNSQFVHSGTYGGKLGPVSSLGYLSQTLTTYGGQNYLLSLWVGSPNMSGTTTPNEFSVSWNGSTIFDQSNFGKIGWTNLQFIVTAAGPSTVLKLGFRDDPYYLGLDDISVTPIPVPAFKATTITYRTLNLTWATATGLVYQVQYKTNLLQTNWINLGKLLIATNASLTVSDTNAVGSSPQRFYRLMVWP